MYSYRVYLGAVMKRFSFFIFFLFLSVFFANTIALQQPVSAVDGRSYTLVYPDDEEAQKKIKAEITSSGIGDGNGGLETTYILVRNGILGTMQFNFDREKSNSQDVLIYSAQIYCTVPKDAATKSSCTTSPPADSIYATFDMTIGIDPGSSSDFLNKNSFRASAGAWDGGTKNLRIPNVAAVFTLDAKSKIKWKIHAKLQTDSDWDEGQYRGNDPHKLEKVQADKLIRDKIMNNLVERSAYISVFQKLTEAQQNAWDAAAEAAGLTKPSEAPATAAGAGGEGEVGVNCQGGPMGWLFCPMINYMTDALQITSRLIDSLMQVRFLAQEGDSEKIKQAWGAFLSIANILLVIAFMVIVFSQSTGAGLSNYGIKRMLPRLVIAAILMNISFYICALAIDVSNIAGASIMGLFIGSGSVSDAMIAATGGEGGGGILGGALGGALLIGLLWFILVPVVLAIILVFVCLVARQLILLSLVLAAPLAFVAWLLPNTEQYFRKWRELFMKLLVLYPMVMAVFGASLFFAKFIGGGGQAIDVGTDSVILTQIIQLVVLCIPLVAIPAMIKGSSSIMGKIGGWSDKIGGATAGRAVGWGKGRTGNFAKERALGTEARMARLNGSDNRFGRALGRAGSYRARKQFKKDTREALRKSNQDEAVTDFYSAGGDEGLASRRARGIAGIGNAANIGKVEAQIAGRANELFGQKLKLEEAKLSGKSTSEIEDALRNALDGGDLVGAHAAASMLAQKGGPGVEAASKIMHDVANNQGFDSEAAKIASSVVKANGKDFNASDPALTKWADQDPTTGNARSLGQITAESSTYTKASPEKMVTWNVETIQQATTAAARSGDTAALRAQAQQLLQSQSASGLSPEARRLFENI